MKALIILFVLFFSRNSFCQELEESLRRTTPESSNELENELKKMLGGLTNEDILGGIKDPGVDTKKLISEGVSNLLAKTLAEALIFSAPAVESFNKYKKKKDKELANEIAEIRDEYTKEFSELQKLIYNTLKLKTQRYLAVSKISSNEFDNKFGLNESKKEIKNLDKYTFQPSFINSDFERKISSKFTIKIADNEANSKILKVVKKEGKSVNLSTFDRMKLAEIVNSNNLEKRNQIAQKELKMRELAKEREQLSTQKFKLKTFSAQQ